MSQVLPKSAFAKLQALKKVVGGLEASIILSKLSREDTTELRGLLSQFDSRLNEIASNYVERETPVAA